MSHIAHETAVCHNPHNLPNHDPHITKQLGYQRTFYQNVVSTKKNCLSLYFCKILTCFHVGLLRICEVFSVCSTIVYWWVMRDCCFLSNVFVTDLNELG